MKQNCVNQRPSSIFQQNQMNQGEKSQLESAVQNQRDFGGKFSVQNRQFLFKKEIKNKLNPASQTQVRTNRNEREIGQALNGVLENSDQKINVNFQKQIRSECKGNKQQQGQIKQKQHKMYNQQFKTRGSTATDALMNPFQILNQKHNKKEQKINKKKEKEKNHQQFGEQTKLIVKDKISPSLLQEFQLNYPYYIIAEYIVYPIEDSLFQIYPELTNFIKYSVLPQPTKQMSQNFRQQLQVWNMLIQNPDFFDIKSAISISDISKLLDKPYSQLFKNCHKFYFTDILYTKYEDAVNEDYFSFISLWKYAEQNQFNDKLFETSWNKFIYFYLQIHKSGLVVIDLIKQYNRFEMKIMNQLQNGEFKPPSKYEELLDYIVFLLDLCFETCTFKALINNKMLFFRDNNKIKNELIEDKKQRENKLWELKDHQKALIKRQKTNLKMIKKEQKTRNYELIEGLNQQMEQIQTQKKLLQSNKKNLNQQIVQIDNKIYQLCCLPQFSNVWLLGEDRFRNLYWFIREQEKIIYKQEKETGKWFAICGKDIDTLQQKLNTRGIRERKLYEKVLYYKQLGYLKTDKYEQNEEKQQQKVFEQIKEQENENKTFKPSLIVSYDQYDVEHFNYQQIQKITPENLKLMILKSQFLMNRYLYERNSKWTHEEHRQEYINKIISHSFEDLTDLTQELRMFNEKICVVEINIRLEGEEGVDLKTRKIQTKIWGINEKYKHSWYDYSRKCKSLSDLHFLVSVLYLTIEKYVTKTRKPNNTKYFYKTVEFGEHAQENQNQYNHELQDIQMREIENDVGEFNNIQDDNFDVLDAKYFH